MYCCIIATVLISYTVMLETAICWTYFWPSRLLWWVWL